MDSVGEGEGGKIWENGTVFSLIFEGKIEDYYEQRRRARTHSFAKI